MASKTYFYQPLGISSADLAPLLAVGAMPTVSTPTGVLILPVRVDEANKDDLDAAMSSLGYSYVGESTDSLPGSTKDYGARAAAPTSPSPGAGDTYYNTSVAQWYYYNGSSWVPFQGPDVLATMVFGAGTLSPTTTPRYLFPGYSTSLAQTIPVQIEAGHSGVLKNLRLRHNVPAGNGGNIVYTVRVNDVATSISVSLASTGTSGADVTNTASVSSGDRVDIIVTKAVNIASSPSDVTATLDMMAQ